MKHLTWMAALVMLASCPPTDVRAVSISAANGVSLTPPSLQSPVNGQVAVADPAQLIPNNQFATVNDELSKTLAAQGFTAGNNWIYAFKGLPQGITNPVGLPANANFLVTAYNLHLNAAQNAFGELFNMTLQNPPPTPAVPKGATITSHWLQLLNESSPFVAESGKPFGFQIKGYSGYWQVDNGDVSWAKGVAPFYDSNNGPNVTPPNFHDDPKFYSGVGTYLHFITIPSWDVSYQGKDYILVGNSGVEWGFSIQAPEPSAFVSGSLCFVLVVIAVRVQWGRARLCTA